MRLNTFAKYAWGVLAYNVGVVLLRESIKVSLRLSLVSLKDNGFLPMVCYR
jgi:hypothetical protein